MFQCVVASVLLGNVYVSAAEQAEDGSEGDERENAVYEGVFLWAWLRGEKIDRNSDKVRITRRGTFGGDAPGLPRPNTAEEMRELSR